MIHYHFQQHERLDNILVENRNDYRSIQQDYEQLRITATDESETVMLSESAQVPTRAIQQGRLYLLIGAAIGLVAGAGLAFLLEYLDDTIKTLQDVTDVLGIDTLGSIPNTIDGDNELVVAVQPRSPTAESFRMLSTNLRFYSLDKSLRILLVTSPEPGAGKSITVANLAAAIAMSGSNVTIVDADLRRPRQHVIFELKSGQGVTGSLLDGNWKDRIQGTQVENLNVLTSGQKLPPNPTELLGSHAMAEMLADLSANADIILIDSPPVLSIADTAALVSWVDGVIFVVESGATRLQSAQQAISNLRQVGANIVGAVLNSVPPKLSPYNYYQTETQPEIEGGKTSRIRNGKIFSATQGWISGRNIRSIFGWIQIPSIRGWFQSRRS